jgi:hypothetical protein
MEEAPQPNQTEAEPQREAQDEVILDALATGLSYRQGGELAGVSARTVRRRTAEEGFAQEVHSQHKRGHHGGERPAGQCVGGSRRAGGTGLGHTSAHCQGRRWRRDERRGSGSWVAVSRPQGP